MDIFQFRNFCLSLPYAEESQPFDEETLVYKIGGKIFAAAELSHFDFIAVKCDPDEAIRLRDLYEDVREPRYFNKRHWNFLSPDGDLPEAFIEEQIRASYLLVLHHSVTPRALREELLGKISKK